MPDYQALKTRLYQSINSMIESRIAQTEKAINAATLSRDNETKSSAGDKYETGRAMMQNEIDKLQGQLYKAKHLKMKLKAVQGETPQGIVANGSLVITGKVLYLIGVGVGRIVIDDQTIFCISHDAPVGQLLFNKQVGDEVLVQGKKVSITNII